MGSSAHAQDKLKVIVFPGLSNLAQFAAKSQGFYKKRNLAVEIIYTPNSDELRNGLAQGKYDIAHGGVDNAVAQVENDKTDLFIFMGGNSGLNSLYVQPEIKSYEQLRGTTMAVDAVNTAFALLLYKMLDVKGIKRSEYKVAAGRRDPSADRGDAEGQDLFGSDAFAARLGAGAEGRAEGSRLGGQRRRALSVGRRLGAASWGKANADTLTRYIQANVEGIRWALDPGEPRRVGRRSSRNG